MPDEFKWSPLNPGYPGQEVFYKLGITPVARLSDRLGGTWFALLDYHLPDVKRVRDCTSYEAGRRGVELWAARHADRLRAEIGAQHEAWVETQPWRPRERLDDGSAVPTAGQDRAEARRTAIPEQVWVGRRSGAKRKSSRHRSPI
jgi:hypothetical protein